MNKHILAIFLFLFGLLFSSPVEARLTLGVVAGTDQAHFLANQLAEELEEEVVVKELADAATLVDWLDRFAALDLALLSAPDVKEHRGRFLLIGQFAEHGELNLVVRQGAAGDLPKRAARIVRESGFAPWRSAETAEPSIKPTPQEDPFAAVSKPISIDEVIAEQVELQHVPPLSPGRAWQPQAESAFQGILSSEEPTASKLVLGVIPDPQRLLRTTQQAEQLAAYLENSLPVSVTVREFTRLETFVEWFMRYRMVDLAVLPPAVADENLGRDYQPLAKLYRSDKPGDDSAELIVMRRDKNVAMQESLQRVILEMKKTTDGQTLMTGLAVSEALAPVEGLSQPPAVDQGDEPVVEVEPVVELEKSPIELAVELVEKPLPPTIEYPEPVEPLKPADVVTKVLPELPVLVSPAVTLSALELPGLSLDLPQPPAMMPEEPARPAAVEAVMLPAVLTRQSEPLPPILPPKPTIAEPLVSPELAIAFEEPVAPEVPALPVVESLPRIPGEIAPVSPPVEPTLTEVPFVLQEKLVSAPDTVAELPVVPEIPAPPVVAVAPQLLDVPAVETAPAPLPEEPVSVLSEPQEVVVPEPVTPPMIEPLETVVVPEVSEPPVVAFSAPEVEEELVADEIKLVDERQKILEEVLLFADAVPAHEPTEATPIILSGDELLDAEVLAILGEDTVAAMVAQSDLPQELLPSGVPVVRPGRVTRRTTVIDENLLVASMPEPRKQVEPPRPPNLLPEPEPEPGVIYVIPFVAIMVPSDVGSRIFDQFVDELNREGESLGLQFVILKEGLQRVSPEWLAVRKYVTGEIYAYVEDSGCCSTDLRTKARLTYRRPDQQTPVFGFEYPVKSFFDHDNSTIDVERARLADDIATTLASELLIAIQN